MMIRLISGELLVQVPYANGSVTSDLAGGSSKEVEPDLLAALIQAIMTVAKNGLRTVQWGHSSVIFEMGDSVLAVLGLNTVTDPEPYRQKLADLILEFEDSYANLLNRYQGDVRVFREFALNIVRAFPLTEVDQELIPCLTEGRRIVYRVGRIDANLSIVEKYINGKRQVGQIVDSVNLPQDETTALISILMHHGQVRLKRQISDECILLKMGEPSQAISNQYPEIVRLLSFFDGSSTVAEVVDASGIDRTAARYLVSKMVDADVLKHADEVGFEFSLQRERDLVL
jgi:hypothetical protein